MNVVPACIRPIQNLLPRLGSSIVPKVAAQVSLTDRCLLRKMVPLTVNI